MNELEKHIQSYFGINDDLKLKKIVSLFRPQSIKKGDFLLHAEKRCSFMGFVQSGILRVFVSTEDKEITQWICTKGQFATDIASFIFGSPSRWSIQALADTQIYVISQEDYQKMGQIIHGWSELEKLFLFRCFSILEDRIFSHLSLSAEERYSYFFQNNKDLFTQVPLKYIASMLGMTPETFSRIRKKQLG